MNCMKCRRETVEGDIFCPECLEIMEKHPVRVDSVVLLPTRRSTLGSKKQHQRRQTPQEQIAALERRCRRLRRTLFATVLLTAALIAASVLVIREVGVQTIMGQNYSTVTETYPNGTGGPR